MARKYKKGMSQGIIRQVFREVPTHSFYFIRAHFLHSAKEQGRENFDSGYVELWVDRPMDNSKLIKVVDAIAGDGNE